MAKSLSATTLAICLAIVFTVTPAAAEDFQSVPGHVVQVNPMNFPSQIVFQMDAAVGNCPAGAALWTAIAANLDQYTLWYSTLLAAQLSGEVLHVSGFNGSNGNNCIIDYFYLTKS